VDGSADADADADDVAGSEAEVVGAGLEGAGLDGVVEADVDGATLGVGDVVEGAGLDDVVDLTGLGVGEVFFGCGEDGDGVGDALVGDDPEDLCPRDGVGDIEG